MLTTMTPKGYIKSTENGIVVSVRARYRRELDARWGINCGNDRALAERLIDAIDAGAVITDLHEATDIYGAKYLHFNAMPLMGRRLSSDLKKLGW